jgi:glycogen synthase
MPAALPSVRTASCNALLDPAEGRSMTIAFVSREYPPSARMGGIAVYVRETARNLALAGHAVWVLCASDDVRRREESADGPVRVIRLPGADFWIGQGRSLPQRLRSAYRAVRHHRPYRRRLCDELLALHAKARLDLVEFCDYGNEALVWASEPRPVPWIVRLHGPTAVDFRTGGPRRPLRQPASWWQGRRELRTVGAADAISAPSRAMASFAASALGATKRIAVIPNAIDVTDWRAAAARAGGARPRIFSAGTLVETKGHWDLVQAVHLLRREGHDIELEIVGRNGAMGERLRQLQSQDPYAAWLRIGDMLPRAELACRFAAADIVVLASWWESFGLTCVEAMASGALVVASAAGGQQDIIRHDVDGLLFSPRNPDALAAAIARAIALPPEAAAAMRANARARVTERYSMEALLPEQVGFYRQVIGGSRRAKSPQQVPT